MTKDLFNKSKGHQYIDRRNWNAENVNAQNSQRPLHNEWTNNPDNATREQAKPQER